MKQLEMKNIVDANKADVDTKKPNGRVAKFFGRFIQTAGLLCSLAAASCNLEYSGMPRPDITDARQDTVAADTVKVDSSKKDGGKDLSADAMHDLKVSDILAPDTKLQWWDLNWKYCREITVSGSFPADYQLNVKLDSSNFDFSHANSDLSDLRFFEGSCVDPDTSIGVLPAWAEKVDSVNGSSIWVKGKTANATQLAMYYGNSNAASTFDGNKTFDFFEDCNDVSDWTVVKNTSSTYAPTFSSVSGKCRLSGTNADGYAYATSYSFKDIILEMELTLDYTPGGNDAGFIARRKDDDHYYQLGVNFVANNVAAIAKDAAHLAIKTLSYTFGTGVKKNIRADLNLTSLELKVDGSTKVSATDSTYSSTGAMGVVMECKNESGGGYCQYTMDDIRARKLISPEPTNQIGAEKKP